MNKKNIFGSLFIWLIGSILIFGITACASETPEASAPPTEVVLETSTEPVPEPDPTDQPTEPASQPTVILVSSSEADPGVLSQAQTALEVLASDAELILLVAESLDEALITPNVKVVIGVGSGLDLGRLAEGAPEVSFLAIDDPGSTVMNNLSVIGDPIVDQQHLAFMAGYFSALISSDNKIAALVPSDMDTNAAWVDTYVVGARFFCGLCRPQFPPYSAFPQSETLSSDNAAEGFHPVIDQLVVNGVEVLFVHGQLASPELLAYLAEVGIKVVGDARPDVARNNWVGTLTIDPGPALVELWADLLSGSAGVQIPGFITVKDTEAGLVSEGRYRLFENMVADLQAGLVLAEPVP
jgi:hypothetical protein